MVATFRAARLAHTLAPSSYTAPRTLKVMTRSVDTCFSCPRVHLLRRRRHERAWLVRPRRAHLGQRLARLAAHGHAAWPFQLDAHPAERPLLVRPTSPYRCRERMFAAPTVSRAHRKPQTWPPNVRPLGLLRCPQRGQVCEVYASFTVSTTATPAASAL